MLGRFPPQARGPLTAFIASLALLVLGLALFGPGARPWLLSLAAFSGAYFLWTVWDVTRGRSAHLESLRMLWASHLGGARNADDIHFMEDGQPLIARLALDTDVLSAAVLTPLSENTTAFRITPKQQRTPSFEGLYPAHSGPPVQPLPGLGALLGDALHIEGNQPAQLARWLDAELLTAIGNAARDHGASFGGLTFDGRFLGIHWRGEVVRDPKSVAALSAPLWRPFVPRLPPMRPELLN